MNIVTGAFGYIGKYITRELLNRGQQVRTITTHPDKPNPFSSWQLDGGGAMYDNQKSMLAQCSLQDKLRRLRN